MTVSQQLNHINENNYDDQITIYDIPKGHFPAIVSNTLAQGSATREMTVEIMALEQSAGGTMGTNSGLYIRGADETAVKVVVQENGKQVAEITQSYS